LRQRNPKFLLDYYVVDKKIDYYVINLLKLNPYYKPTRITFLKKIINGSLFSIVMRITERIKWTLWD